MHTILGDGESKVGKTSVTNAIVEGLTPDYSVEVADAGAFYRRLTVATLDRLPVRSEGQPIDPVDLEIVLDGVIADGVAYEDSYEWGDLERPEISSLVSTVGRSSQKAGKEWYGRTAAKALESHLDVLVLNGRNPRARLCAAETGIPAAKLGLCLELVIQCDPEVAGQRAAYAHYGSDPSAVQVAEQRALIIERRRTDRERPDTPYVDPVCLVPFEVGDLAVEHALDSAWKNFAKLPPAAIGFDTSHMPMDIMTASVQALARTALSLLN